MSDPAVRPDPDEFAGRNLRMSRAEYRRWAEAQPSGRFELIDGRVVAMSPERVAHLRVKAQAWLALRRASNAAGLASEVLPDGATVEVDDSDFEPDAVLYCGPSLPPDSIAVPDPVVIVEVLSPSTRVTDLTLKAAAYLKVQSVRHYLILFPDRPRFIHHRRATAGSGWETQVVTDGEIGLDPPGLAVTVAEIYGAQSPRSGWLRGRTPPTA